MKHHLQDLLQNILKEMGIEGVTPDVSISEDSRHGEYMSNVAMKIAAKSKVPPIDIALQVSQLVNSQKLTVNSKRPAPNTSKIGQKISGSSALIDILQAIDRVEVVPPGFINIFLSEASLSTTLTEVLKDGERYGTSQSGKGKKVMVEFTDPNPFKEFHIGHLYSNAVGESLARLHEAIGWKVKRADYFGDVGMHVAKSIWGMKKQLSDPANPTNMANLEHKPLAEKARWLGQCYALGAAIYEEKTPEAEKAKEEMKDINYMVYLAAQEHMQETLRWKPVVDYRQYVKVDDTLYKEVKALFEAGRTWSMDYFESIFRRLGTKFDYYYPESIVGEYGAKLVREHAGKVFEESDGAIVYRGEKDGLHTRVFMNALGLPTYEAKELGLNWKKFEDYSPDLSFNVTGNEINEYFRVLFSVMRQVIPDVAAKTRHIGHGMVRNADGTKMSSRTGNVLTGEGLLDEVKESIYNILKQSKSKYTKLEHDEIAEKAAVAAVKYSLLRVALPSNVAFSLKTSVSFDGDSGPYLLYSYARCKSVLKKVPNSRITGSVLGITEKSDSLNHNTKYVIPDTIMNSEERALARLVSFFPEIVADAAENLSPNVLCTYLFKLAQSFNLFYQKHPILNTESGIVNTDKENTYHDSKISIQYSNFRLALTAATAQILKNGLYLLGISTVERM